MRVGKMREILPDIFMWSRLSEPRGYNFNGHLIRTPDGNLCIDPVEPNKDDAAEIGCHGVTRILLTNRNHSRAANLDRKSTRLNYSHYCAHRLPSSAYKTKKI